MKILSRLLFTLCMSFLLLSCSILGGDDTPEYIFTADVRPAASGTVSPDSISVEENETVLAEAIPAEGYLFENWTGDISSDEKKLSFEITEDTDVTANFREISSRYEVEMTVADDTDSMILKFGQNTSSSDGFDEDNDRESPPPPPEGSLHSYFKKSDNDLVYDYRGDKDLNPVWNMQYQIGSGSTLKLSWNTNITSIEGNLTLSHGESSTTIDMISESSVDISVSDSGSLTIEYEVVN